MILWKKRLKLRLNRHLNPLLLLCNLFVGFNHLTFFHATIHFDWSGIYSCYSLHSAAFWCQVSLFVEVIHGTGIIVRKNVRRFKINKVLFGIIKVRIYGCITDLQNRRREHEFTLISGVKIRRHNESKLNCLYLYTISCNSVG